MSQSASGQSMCTPCPRQIRHEITPRHGAAFDRHGRNVTRSPGSSQTSGPASNVASAVGASSHASLRAPQPPSSASDNITARERRSIDPVYRRRSTQSTRRSVPRSGRSSGLPRAETARPRPDRGVGQVVEALHAGCTHHGWAACDVALPDGSPSAHVHSMVVEAHRGESLSGCEGRNGSKSCAP
jgi:hypothetical protein